MATIQLHHDNLIVDVNGMDKLWALTSRLTIPLQHVRGATFEPGTALDDAGIRVGGARIAGIFTAGTFQHDGDRVFWDVHDPHNVVVIELSDERYARLVVEVDNPRYTAQLIHDAIANR